MNRSSGWTIAALVAAATMTMTAAPKPKFTSVFKTPAAREVSFAGKKVAALIISDDQGLRVSGEEALARELTSRGLQGVAAYRIIPREETKSPERAKEWFEKSGVEGVVAMRPVSIEDKTNYIPSTWVNPYYGTLWGYYGYGWGSLYIPGSISQETVVKVETTIYSVPRNALLWAAVSETKDPKTLGTFVQDLVTASVKELQRQGLAKQVQKK